MKLTGITGTGTGKLGSSVFATVAGQQIVRQYQPVVANPSTQAQVEQRAKLKLGSQLARDLKIAIAISRQGLVTSRNRFISKNFPAISFQTNSATVNLNAIQLTEGSNAMTSIASAVADSGRGGFVITFADATVKNFDKVCVYAFKKNEDNQLSFLAMDEVDTTRMGQDNSTVLTVADGADIPTDAIIYAYGLDFASEGAKARYGELSVNAGITAASLIASRSQLASEMIPSRTVSSLVTGA